MIRLSRIIVMAIGMISLRSYIPSAADAVKSPHLPTQEQETQLMAARSQRRDALIKGVTREKMAHLQGLTLQEKLDLVEGVQWDRRKFLEEVSPQLNSKNPPDVIFAAASLLGDYHIQEAVSNITRFITLENKGYAGQEGHLPLWSHYPIVDVLIKMGQPSVSSMIDNLATSDDEKVRNLSAFVIRSVYQDVDIDKLVIQKAIAKEPDPTKKQRLQTALKYFGAVPIPLEEPRQPAK